MADINFGILAGLQNQAPPISQVDAETSPENYRANLNAGTQLAGVLAQAGVAQQANAQRQRQSDQQFAIDSAKYGLDQAKQNQQMQFAEQGNAAAQELAKATAGQATIQTSKLQQDWQLHNQGMVAYNKVLKSGGSQEEALNALSQQIAQSDPDHYLQLQKTIEEQKQDVQKNKHTNLTDAAGAILGIQQSGADPYEVVRKNWNMLSKEFPGLPNPNTVSNSAQYSNLITALIGSATGAQEITKNEYARSLEAYKSELQQKNDMAKQKAIQLTTGDNTASLMAQADALTQKLTQLDPNSKEAATVATQIKQLKSEISKKTAPSIMNSIAGGLGITPSDDGNIISKAINGMSNYNGNPSAPRPQQPAMAPQAPQQQQHPLQHPQIQQVTQQAQQLGYKPVMVNGQVMFVPSQGQ